MNLANAFTVSVCLTVASAAPTARAVLYTEEVLTEVDEKSVAPIDRAVAVAVAVVREEFCYSLAALESHMTNKSAAMNNDFHGNRTQCHCSEVHTNDNSFTIVCSMEGTHDGDINDIFVQSEHMVFELDDQGEYDLRETSWSYQDSEVSYDSQEIFHLKNGTVTSCLANGCTSCSVCDDKKSIAVDCTNQLGYKVECSESYTGSFSNTFNFGVITPDEYFVDPTESAVDREQFCESLAALESHMTKKSAAMNNNFHGNSTQCDCSELHTNDDSFNVVCSMEGTHDDGSNDLFVQVEHIVFELDKEGDYDLRETSWSYQDSKVSYISQEVFHLRSGTVTSCEANGCSSCFVCDDKKSIAVDCSNQSPGYKIECNEGYTGSFSHTFDFGLIRPNVVNEHRSCHLDGTCRIPSIVNVKGLSYIHTTS